MAAFIAMTMSMRRIDNFFVRLVWLMWLRLMVDMLVDGYLHFVWSWNFDFDRDQLLDRVGNLLFNWDRNLLLNWNVNGFNHWDWNWMGYMDLYWIWLSYLDDYWFWNRNGNRMRQADDHVLVVRNRDWFGHLKE